jgi:hypothetical protein
MLWPQKRDRDPPPLGDMVHGRIDRTTQTSWLIIAPKFVPDLLKPIEGILSGLYPGVVFDPDRKAEYMKAFPGYPDLPADMKGTLVLGPIPQGMPVNLLADTMLRSESKNPIDQIVHAWRMLVLVNRLAHDLHTLPRDASVAALHEHFEDVRQPLLQLSKCPDFVVNRGHLFGTDIFNRQAGLTADERSWGTETALNDDDKRALIAFLKTF